MSWSMSPMSREGDSLLERLETCLEYRTNREVYLLKVVGDFCVKLNYRGSGDHHQMGRAELHRRWNLFTRDGEDNEDEESYIIGDLSQELSRPENNWSGVQGQGRAESVYDGPILAAYNDEIRKSGEKSLQITNLERKKVALEKTSSEQGAKIQRLDREAREKDKEIRKSEAKNIQITSLERKKSALEMTSSEQAAKLHRLIREGGEKDDKIRTLQTSILSRARRVTVLETNVLERDRRTTGLQSQVNQLQAVATARLEEIKQLNTSVTSKDEEIAKITRDFEDVVNKMVEHDMDYQGQIKKLEVEIKQVKAYRPSIDSTCRLIEMAYREFQIGKPSIEQEVLRQQDAIARLDPQDLVTRDLTYKLQDQRAATCLLEWKVQEQETEIKDIKATMQEQIAELEDKEAQIKVLFEKVTERMYKLKSGNVLEKGRRVSF